MRWRGGGHALHVVGRREVAAVEHRSGTRARNRATVARGDALSGHLLLARVERVMSAM
jgi:hypothetical protein